MSEHVDEPIVEKSTYIGRYLLQHMSHGLIRIYLEGRYCESVETVAEAREWING